MSQNDFNIANQGFPATRADINSALQALASNSAGTAEPSTTYAYQFWYDETNELLKMRNSDNDAWITIGTFDQTGDTFTPAGLTTDKIEEGNSSVEVVDTGTGYVAITVDGVEAARVDANGRLGIGTTSPESAIHIDAADSATSGFRMKNTAGESVEFYYASSAADADFLVNRTGSGAADIGLKHTGDVYFTSGDVGIGTSSPATNLEISDATEAILRLTDSGSSAYSEIRADAGTLQLRANQGNAAVTSYFRVDVNATERMRIDSSGNLLVGTTDATLASTTDAGVVLTATGEVTAARSGNVCLLNRLDSDGSIAEFRKDGSTVGSIATYVGDLFIGTGDCGIRFDDGGNLIAPININNGLAQDNLLDLGAPTARWDDIYATNGTIQTSDRNEKQDIEELTDVEQRVAVAAKGLLRKYRWKDAVAEKGDEARIHFGIIAQDLQAAFEAEGLDAGRYGMFISSTWWEADRIIPAVEAQDAVYETVVIPAEYDADGNEISPETTEERLVSEAVEAQPERTVTDTYETQEEAPEGAVERTRMGVRYPELLAFIIAAI